MGTARPMDLPLPSMENPSTARKRFGKVKPGTANENGTQQGVPPLRATSGAKVNADVRSINP